jgi:hypothetical protein
MKIANISSTRSMPMNFSWFFKSLNDVLTGVPGAGWSKQLSTNYKQDNNEISGWWEHT